MNTIQAGFESFKKEVIPANAPEIQQKEMQRAFYSGAGWIIGILAKLSDPEVSEDAALQIVENLRVETVEYLQSVVEGKY